MSCGDENMRHKLMKISPFAALIFFPACSFTVDDIFVDTPADGGADTSTSGGDNDPGQGTTGDGKSTTGGESPTGWGTNGDGTGQTTGATTGPGGNSGGGAPMCDNDGQCQAGMFCELLPGEKWGYCRSRCDGDTSCRSVALENALGPTVSDDQHVCFGTLPSVGAQGVPNEDASLYVWDLEHEPVVLASALPSARALFITDDLCYFATDSGLMRVPLTGESAPELIGSARGDKLKAWPTAEHIWWNHPVQGIYELWRIERTTDATPERFAKPTADWETGSSKLVVRFSETQNQIIAAPLANLAMESEIALSQAMQVHYGYTRLVIHEDALYYDWIEFEGNLIHRVDLEDPAAPLQVMDVGYPSPHDHLHEFFFADTFFIWAVPDASKTYYRVLREPLDLSEPAVVIAKIPNHSSLSLVSNIAVYRSQGDLRGLTARPLFAVPDVPAP
jgi:hypothetical protein